VGKCGNSVLSLFKAGIWKQVLEDLQADSDAQGKLDWQVHYVDGTVVRAHQHAAGGKKGAFQDERLGRSRGGFSTKIHIRCEGKGFANNFSSQSWSTQRGNFS
jgi:hypothetical protein